MKSFLILLVLLAAGARGPAALEVRLRAEAEVATDFVLLRDVAETPEAGLGALVVGRSPEVGACRTLDCEDVRTAVRRARPELREVEMTGALAVAVSRVAPRTVPGSDAVAEAIRRWGPLAGEAGRGARCEVEVLEVEPAPEAGLPLLVKAGERRGDAWEFVLVAVDLAGEGSGIRARALVRLTAEAATARRNLPPRRVLAASDLETRTVEVMPGAHWFPAGAWPVGRCLDRALRAGEVLSDAALRAEFVVRAQDPVRIDVPGPGFAVRLEGKALEGGPEGREIRVKTKDGAVMRARIVGPGRVQLVQGEER